jgi:hypothetical protein
MKKKDLLNANETFEIYEKRAVSPMNMQRTMNYPPPDNYVGEPQQQMPIVESGRYVILPPDEKSNRKGD